LQGTGKFMRHVKLRPGTATNAAALSRLIDAAYSDIKARVEHGYLRETSWEDVADLSRKIGNDMCGLWEPIAVSGQSALS
jgi:hypothetical protein